MEEMKFSYIRTLHYSTVTQPKTGLGGMYTGLPTSSGTTTSTSTTTY